MNMPQKTSMPRMRWVPGVLNSAGIMVRRQSCGAELRTLRVMRQSNGGRSAAQHSVRMRTSKAGGHTAMNTGRFNQLYPVGTKFMHIPNPVLRGGRVVSTVAPARDFKCDCIVEINVEPYFVKVETLKSPH